MSKRIISIALALVMLVGVMAMLPTTAKAAEYTAKLGFADTAWGAQEWGDTVNATVTGDGTYTLSWDLTTAAVDAGVFVIDIAGAQAELDAENKTYNVTALSVSVDGNEIPVDLSKILTGDLEGNGNYRIEIYNQYGSTKDNAPIDPAAVNPASNLTITFTIETVEKPAEDGGETDAVATEFNATLGFADTAWGAQEWGENVNVTVTGDGTYTLSWNPETAAIDAGVFVIDIVGAQAALGASNQTYNLTALTITVDGNEIPVDLSKVVTGDIEENGNYRIEIYNQYGATKDNAPIDPAAVTPASNLTISFTLEVVEAVVDVACDLTANLSYANSDWSVQEWGENVNTAITGIGTYSLTLNGAANDALVFCVDIVGAATELAKLGVELTLEDLKLYADGVEIPVDLSKVATGDLEENGNFRIEIYNDFGSTKENPPIDGLTFASELKVEFTLGMVKCEGGAVEEAPAVVEIDKNGTYNAYLMLQTPNWTFRNAWDEPYYGIDGTGWEAIGNTWGQYLVHADADKAGMTWGNITDAVIAGNGTYTLSITDFGTLFADDFAAAGQEYFNIIAISTDLPAGANVTITDVKLFVDGQERHSYAEAYINTESTTYLQVMIQNIWNADVKELNYYPAPSESLEIQFTISGFDYDKAGTSAPAEDPTDTPSTPSDTPAATEPAASDTDAQEPNDPTAMIIIAVVAVVVIAVVVVVVLKKKKA